MKRDYSESAKQELFDLADKVEEEKWCGATDWLGDRFLDAKGFFGGLNIDNYLDNIDSYHKQIIDKNNISKEKLKRIFDTVEAEDECYSVRFAALDSRLQDAQDLFQALASCMGSSSIDSIQGSVTSLKNAIEDYNKSNKIYEKLIGNGITPEDMKNMANPEWQHAVMSVIGRIAEVMPGINVGQAMTIPIGAGLSVFYKVDGSFAGEIPANINMKIDGHKAMFENLSLNPSLEELGIGSSMSSDGQFSTSVSSDQGGSSVSIGLDGKASISGETQVTHDNVRVKTKAELEVDGGFTFEEIIEEKLSESDTLTSTMGVKKENDNGWKRLPVTEPVQNPVVIRVPEIDVDWDRAIGTVVLVGGVALVVTGVILAPYSGGASLVLCAV